LHEGVSQRAADMDIVYINGYGFPIWRGGPMHYANQTGLDIVVNKIQEFAKKDPDSWQLSPYLSDLASSGKKLGDAPDAENRKEILNFRKNIDI